MKTIDPKDLINKFEQITAEYNKIPEHNRHYILEDMERLVKRVYRAKLNGLSVEDFRKLREWSWESTDDYLNDVEGLEEHLFENIEAEITLGMGATIILHSDRYGCTITSLSRNKKGVVNKVGVKYNKYTIKDWRDGYGDLSEELEGDEQFYTLRQHGGWYAEGQPKRHGSVKLAIGYRETYRDPSF